MKALKNESTSYLEQIVSAVQSCYVQNAEPTNIQLTALYSLIGKCICQQGEKAFVAHLAILLAEQLPQIGGFSMRNLRRMRDFYRTYENQSELMKKARALGWTQNAVILDCCETDAQRYFYMELAAEKNLSKLALMKAISAKTFESKTEETVDTGDISETKCGAFVTACGPFHQGYTPSMDDGMSKASSDNIFRRLLVFQKVIEFARIINVYLKQPNLQAQLFKPPPTGQSPPLVALA